MNKTLEAYLDLPYPLLITPDEDGGYGVEIPDLPGCFTHAVKWEDIPAQAREIGSALKHGDPVPEPSAEVG